MSKIFSFDVESDGLYGPGIAVGAVVRENGTTVETFEGRVVFEEIKDEWVRTNVLPVITDLPRYDSPKELRDAFWNFYIKHHGSTIICDVPYPVESRFLMDCVNDDPSRAEFSPYPIIDVASVLYAKHYDPDIDRTSIAMMDDIKKHNPVDDALISALCFEFVVRNC